MGKGFNAMAMMAKNPKLAKGVSDLTKALKELDRYKELGTVDELKKMRKEYENMKKELERGD